MKSLFFATIILTFISNSKSLTLSRRDALALSTSSLFTPFLPPSSSSWSGTNLPHLSLPSSLALLQKQTALDPNYTFPMAKWPDPILRLPSNTTPQSLLNSETLHTIATAVRHTSRNAKAVGLAAQQCGIDASLVFLEHQRRKRDGIFLVNPRILQRSSELDMRSWIEYCLVLPPSFRANTLRDDIVVVEAEDLTGETRTYEFRNEMARAVQHEMDHDEGILILDHVGLEEMSEEMREVESDMHAERQRRAFERRVVEGGRGVEGGSAMLLGLAEEEGTMMMGCDEECRRRIEERRELNRQSRSSSSRREVFELSRQRAELYNTTYQGVSCPPGLPCW